MIEELEQKTDGCLESGVDAYGIPEKRGEMAHLGEEDLLDSAQQQKLQPKLAGQVYKVDSAM